MATATRYALRIRDGSNEDRPTGVTDTILTNNFFSSDGDIGSTEAVTQANDPDPIEDLGDNSWQGFWFL